MIDDQMAAYVHQQRRLLIEQEKQLRDVSDKYGAAKTAFDEDCTRRRISWEENPVAYLDAKRHRIQLGYWYSKVEHFQREVTARAVLIVALDAADRMLDDWTAQRRLAN